MKGYKKRFLCTEDECLGYYIDEKKKKGEKIYYNAMIEIKQNSKETSDKRKFKIILRKRIYKFRAEFAHEA